MGIAHAFADAMSLGAVLENETDRARQVLRVAIADLLGIPDAYRAFYRRKPLSKRAVFAVIRATVQLPPSAFDEVGPMPHFTLEAVTVAGSGDPLVSRRRTRFVSLPLAAAAAAGRWWRPAMSAA